MEVTGRCRSAALRLAVSRFDGCFAVSRFDGLAFAGLRARGLFGCKDSALYCGREAKRARGGRFVSQSRGSRRARAHTHTPTAPPPSAMRSRMACSAASSCAIESRPATHQTARSTLVVVGFWGGEGCARAGKGVSRLSGDGAASSARAGQRRSTPVNAGQRPRSSLPAATPTRPHLADGVDHPQGGVAGLFGRGLGWGVGR